MKVVQINSVCGNGSTGKICTSISDLLTEIGVENYIFYSSGVSSHSSGKKYMKSIDIKWQALKAKIFGNYGFQSKRATKRLIKAMKEISPDIVHLHNLHSHNVHFEMLCTYLRENNIKIIWTFHDCWAFTGYCTHYEMMACYKWKNEGCGTCPQRKKFSWFFDRSAIVYKRKKDNLFNLDIVIITPSQWLLKQVKQSFLTKFEAKCIYNGIDLSIFSPKESDFREKFNLEEKFIVLGVAYDWGKRKGLDVFLELSKLDYEDIQIVIIGTNPQIDKRLPKNIISIHRTNNQLELAEIYTAADVFVNPTREEVLGLTNIEALACGTPVITFDTGGSPECIDSTCGIVVPKNDIDSMIENIIEVYKNRPFTEKDCIERAGLFNMNKKFREYIDLYENIIK